MVGPTGEAGWMRPNGLIRGRFHNITRAAQVRKAAMARGARQEGLPPAPLLPSKRPPTQQEAKQADMQTYADQPDAHQMHDANEGKHADFMRRTHHHATNHAALPPDPDSVDRQRSCDSPRLRSRRADKAQGERERGIGLHGNRRGSRASATLRAGAGALTCRPCRPGSRAWHPSPWNQSEPGEGSRLERGLTRA